MEQHPIFHYQGTTRVLLCTESFKDRGDHDNYSNLHVACYYGHA